MVQISQDIYALDEIWELNFKKHPLSNGYGKYPFLIFDNLLDIKELKEAINSLKSSSYKARISGNRVDENIRKTLIHSPTPQIETIFQKAFFKVKEEAEKFYGVSFLKGSQLQILEYKEGGFYKCHADNANEIIKDKKLINYKVVNNRDLTTLLFLNSNFEGGEIEFCHLRYNNGKRVIYKPKGGDMIIFPSHGLFAHEVKKVKKNSRFAVVKWWQVI